MNNIAFIIEDNEDISNLFVRALKSAGFHAETIFDGKTALSRLEKEPPSLVVLDMHLPQASGEAILAYIREQGHLKETKVIVATADSQLGEASHDSANLVLQKPVTFSQLRDFAERCKTAQSKK